MSLSHSEFRRITPRELKEQMDGYAWREDREMERLAWLASTLIGGITGKKVSITELLGRNATHRVNDGQPKLTREEIERDRRELLARFGEG